MELSPGHELVSWTLAGDQRAFEALMARHAGRLFGRILRKVRSPADAEDLLQEVFVRAYTRLEQLEGPERVGAWLSAIADNQVRMWQRRCWVQLKWEDAMRATEEPVGAAEDPPAAASELRAAVHAALRRLSHHHRQVLVHHYLKGYTYAQTGALLDLAEDTVRSRLQKGRKRLRKEIMTMPKSPPSQLFTLTDSDLRAFRRAVSFVSADPQRPVLQGIYLDAGGKIVATDGSRLFLWQAPGLEQLTVPVLLGPWHELRIPESEQAALEVGPVEALLAAAKGQEQRIPVMEGPYVKYEQVMPPDRGLQVKVESGPFLEALERIVPQLEREHPVGQGASSKYVPQVEICVSSLEQTLSLTTGRDLGYVARDPTGESEPAPEGPEWVFTTSVAVQLEGAEPDGVFRTTVNHTYLTSVVRALELDPEEGLDIQLVDPDTVIQFTASGRPFRRTLLMPMKRQQG